jgi:hypothetical protein
VQAPHAGQDKHRVHNTDGRCCATSTGAPQPYLLAACRRSHRERGTAPSPTPGWCRHIPQGAPYAGSPCGAQPSYDRLAPPEDGEEHEGRDYRLDAGEMVTFAVTVTRVQSYSLNPVLEVHAPQLRLSIVNHELPGAAEAVWLSPQEVGTLIAMLEQAKRELVDAEAFNFLTDGRG